MFIHTLPAFVFCSLMIIGYVVHYRALTKEKHAYAKEGSGHAME